MSFSVDSLCSSFLLPVLGFLVLRFGDRAAAEPNQIFSQASCNFGVDLLKVQLKENEGNVVFSPSSVGVLLAIVQQGAKENTLEELNSVLRMTAKQSRNGFSTVLKSLQREYKNATLAWGNRLYIGLGYNVSYSFGNKVNDKFGVDIQEVNFVEPSPQKVANAMNGWVKKVTHNHIKDLVSPYMLKSDTSLVLLSAIYFKGLWDMPFKKARTDNLNFELRPGRSVEVPFMSQSGSFIVGKDSEAAVQWLNLLFKDDQFSMIFIVPLEKHGLEKVLEKMSGSLLNEIINYNMMKTVDIYIPKFKLREKVMLAKALKELGLKDIFTTDSNLQEITINRKDVSISQIIHEASVEIDEAGSTAAAATIGVPITYSAFHRDSFDFRADHPFLFFIVDRANQMPLFGGRVSDPSSTGDTA